MKLTNLLLLSTTLMVLQNSVNAQSNDSLISHPANDHAVQSILIINAFDALTISARVKKKELFKELTDSLKSYLKNEILLQTGREAKIADDILAAGQNLDSSVRSMMQQEKAEFAVLILSLKVFFSPTESRKEEEENSLGKKTIWVYYDLCATNQYCLYNADTLVKPPVLASCKFLTKRESHTGVFFPIAISPDRRETKAYLWSSCIKCTEIHWKHYGSVEKGIIH